MVKLKFEQPDNNRNASVIELLSYDGIEHESVEQNRGRDAENTN